MIILFSDLLDDPQSTLDGLRHFRFKGQDILVFHILDPAEITFPFEHATRFVDFEGPQEFIAIPSQVKENYLNNLKEHITAFKKGCGQLSIDYHILDTSKALDFALFSYLATRARKG